MLHRKAIDSIQTRTLFCGKTGGGVEEDETVDNSLRQTMCYSQRKFDLKTKLKINDIHKIWMLVTI